MAFDGMVTAAMARELRDQLLYGKIDKIYQPDGNELVLHIHTKTGNKRLYATIDPSASCVRLIDKNPLNPPTPLPFCMLLRKHLQSGRITEIEQKDSERILEISVETLNELGFTVNKKLIFEIMGKHSNIALVEMSSGKIIDCMKKISLDVNRVRQLLPGMPYEYPPAQDKIPFWEITEEQLDEAGDTPKAVLSAVGGIAPCFARALCAADHRYALLRRFLSRIEDGVLEPVVYEDEDGHPQEFYFAPLEEYERTCKRLDFDSLSHACAYFYEHREATNRARQKSHSLVHSVHTRLEKLYLKKQRLQEDLLAAQNSDDLRLYGELLTANMHLMESGMKEITVTNYYDGEPITIPLDPRWSPNKNAQHYFKQYGKAKTAVHEKTAQLEENQANIDYLESVYTYLTNTNSVRDIEDLRQELEEEGWIRSRHASQRRKKTKFKPRPLAYTTSDGFSLLVGRNNKENDALTLKMASKNDYWLHTKDIPGSHVILKTDGKELTETAVMEAAALAAFHSKARTSENVPVDYVRVRYVKKPNGAKPGMVIFTHNRTVYVTPKEPSPAAK